MNIEKKHIALFFAISFVLGLIALAYWSWKKRKPKTTGDLQTKINEMVIPSSMPTTGLGNVNSVPTIYGDQRVVRDGLGVWRLAPDTCNLITTGIIDWTAIQSMSQIEKDTLFNGLENCNGHLIPIIQP